MSGKELVEMRLKSLTDDNDWIIATSDLHRTKLIGFHKPGDKDAHAINVRLARYDNGRFARAVIRCGDAREPVEGGDVEKLLTRVQEFINQDGRPKLTN